MIHCHISKISYELLFPILHDSNVLFRADLLNANLIVADFFLGSCNEGDFHIYSAPRSIED